MLTIEIDFFLNFSERIVGTQRVIIYILVFVFILCVIGILVVCMSFRRKKASKRNEMIEQEYIEPDQYKQSIYNVTKNHVPESDAANYENIQPFKKEVQVQVHQEDDEQAYEHYYVSTEQIELNVWRADRQKTQDAERESYDHLEFENENQ